LSNRRFPNAGRSLNKTTAKQRRDNGERGQSPGERDQPLKTPTVTVDARAGRRGKCAADNAGDGLKNRIGLALPVRIAAGWHLEKERPFFRL